MKKFVCSICQKEYDDPVKYMTCVSKCGENLLIKQREIEKNKRVLEVNACLHKVKKAEKYLKDEKEAFKNKFPEEYDSYFGVRCEDNCDGKHNACKCNSKEDVKASQINDIEVSIVNDRDGKPKFNAKVNGEKVDKNTFNKLVEDPFMTYVAKMLEI